MEYLIIGSVIIVVVLLIIYYSAKIKSTFELEQIRSAWGKPNPKQSYHFVSIARYAEAVKEKYHRLTDQTIEDIDFQRVFTFIDRTTSKVGQQFLYKKVIEPSDQLEDPAEKHIELFTRDKNLREGVQLALKKLSDHEAYSISSLLHDIYLKKPTWIKFLPIDLLMVTGLIIFSFKFPGLLIVLFIPFILNMFLHIYNRENTIQFARSIPQLNVMISVAKELLKRGGLLYDKSVEDSISELKSFQRRAQLVRFKPGGVEVDLSQYLFDLVKVVFLIEVFMVFKVVDELKNKRASILTLFEYIGAIDSSISVASLRAGRLKTCQPTFTLTKKEIVVKNIYHPLIKNCVKNNLTIRNKSILITGSNMSGKSTFLRTLTINSVLAQTIYTCFADEYIAPILKQFSSIRIDDNLFEGKSYYYQEVTVMGSLIEEVSRPHQNLFVLDEVFKGTNSVERISAAKAILSYLNQNDNIVLVSSHDIELVDLLAAEYDLYHFTEIVENDTLHFDHRIKPGRIKTRNAIKILELANYPLSIISEATKLSETQRTTRKKEEE